MEQRTYGGRLAQDRQSERRERWVAAGLDLFGTEGLRGTSLRKLARRSGVAERYFSESFSSLEELLAAVHDQVHAEIRDRVLAAVDTAPDPRSRVEAGLAAVVDALDEDPRKARVKLVETLGAGPLVEQSRQAGLQEIAGHLASWGKPGQPPAGRADGLHHDVLALGVVGGLFELMVARHGGRLTMDREQFLAHCLHLLAGLRDRGAAEPDLSTSVDR